MTGPSDLSGRGQCRDTRQVRQRQSELITHLRPDVGKASDPRAEALFATAEEVLAGLDKACADLQARGEPTCQA